jgi:hypothetical protein
MTRNWGVKEEEEEEETSFMKHLSLSPVLCNLEFKSIALIDMHSSVFSKICLTISF